MPNVLNEYAGDGVTQTFNFSMTDGYLSRDYVLFQTRPNDSILGYEDYDRSKITWLTDFSVRTAEPIPVGTTFVITRATPSAALVDFQNTSRITERNLDTATRQSLHRTVETADYVSRGVVGITALAEVAVGAAEDSAYAAELAASLVLSAEQAATSAANSASVAADLAEDATNTADTALQLIKDAVKGNVDSFNGRDGAVMPEAGDYTPPQVGFTLAGALNGSPVWAEVPAWDSNTYGQNAAAQALTNRTELLKQHTELLEHRAELLEHRAELLEYRADKALLSYPDYAAASAAAATLPDGQVIVSDADEVKGVVVGGSFTQEQTIYKVADYAKIRSYTGRGTRLRVVDQTGAHWWVRRGSAADNGGTVLVDASGRSWEREYSGPTDIKWFAVGDGGSDDGAAISAAFSVGGVMKCTGGIYKIINRTINVIAGTKFIGAGQGKTRFVFYEMGGFNGKDGFDIDVPIGAEYLHITTEISKCDILTEGQYGRAGIKTPTNKNGQGDTLFRYTRPKFIFNNLTLGSLSRTAVASSGLYGVYGWRDCIHTGESADSQFIGNRYLGPFRAANDPLTWGDTVDTSAIHFDCGSVADGGGAIYSPFVSEFTAHSFGKMIKFSGKVVSPRFSKADCMLNGWGFYSDRPYFNEGGAIDAVGEATLDQLNLNGIFGGIYLDSTDFIDINAVRTTFPNLDIPYEGDWFGLKIENGFRQVDIRGFRAACFDATSAGVFRPFDLNGAFRGDAYGMGLVEVNGLYLNLTNSISSWRPAALRNVREAHITPFRVRGTGIAPYMLYAENPAGLTSINPKIYVHGELPYTFLEPVEHGVNSFESHLHMTRNGVTDNWSWVKHSNGSAEMTKTFTSFGTANTASGSIFVSPEVEFDFPFSFVSTPVVNSAVRASGAVFSNSRPVSTSKGAARIFSPLTQSAASILDVRVTGRWK